MFFLWRSLSTSFIQKLQQYAFPFILLWTRGYISWLALTSIQAKTALLPLTATLFAEDTFFTSVKIYLAVGFLFLCFLSLITGLGVRLISFLLLILLLMTHLLPFSQETFGILSLLTLITYGPGRLSLEFLRQNRYQKRYFDIL